jgi:hypothetical protein
LSDRQSQRLLAFSVSVSVNTKESPAEPRDLDSRLHGQADGEGCDPDQAAEEQRVAEAENDHPQASRLFERLLPQAELRRPRRFCGPGGRFRGAL